MRVRAGLISRIYQKALVLSNDERVSRSAGEIMNLMAVDTTRLQDLCSDGFLIISGPFQVPFRFGFNRDREKTKSDCSER
jgi:ATP-binding cassette, subfamily C (CFTR/MRP), member 1